MENAELNARLFPSLEGDELLSLEDYGSIAELDSGDILFSEGEEQNKFCVVLAGEIKVTRTVSGQEMVLAVHQIGEFTGEVSMLAGGPAIATGRATKPSSIRCIPLPEFRSLIASGTPLSIKILQAISTRRPVADSIVQQREKMISLGRLSAGIAHELNNPASAASRASAHLKDAFQQQQGFALDLVRSGATEEGISRLRRILEHFQDQKSSLPKDSLEISDRETELMDWLDDRKIDDAWQIAPVFAQAGISVQDLDKIASKTEEKCFALCLRWLHSALNVSYLVGEIEESTTRISGLVKAIKAYSFMDREGKQEIDIRPGIDDTLTILKHKLKDVEVVKHYDAELPSIWALGGELNQVWTNLIDNAADALSGTNAQEKLLTIEVHRFDDQTVFVEIIDNGPGIPAGIKKSIFDPFFTTKPVGSGTGLGLDTCFRIIVTDHQGDIKVKSQPGETRFQVWLPIKKAQKGKNGHGG